MAARLNNAAAPADVLLWPDSGPAAGAGHVMRVRSVAQALLQDGHRPRVCVEDPSSAARLQAEGFDVVGDVGDAASLRPFRSALLDGFRDWSDAARRLRASGARVVLVENRTPARELCDRLVYPCLHWRADAWDAAHPERVRAGPAWTPLAAELLAVRPAPVEIDLLVTFGGSDPLRLTERVLDALPGALRAVRIAVVVGPHMSTRRADIGARASWLPCAEVLDAPRSLASVMARSAVAVTALGTTLTELAWLGVPALILANWESDRPALAHYAERGPHVPLGIAAELDGFALGAALEQGFERVSARRREPLAELAGGAARIARLLARGEDGGE